MFVSSSYTLVYASTVSVVYYTLVLRSNSFSFPPLPTLVSVGGEVIVLIGQPPLAVFRKW